MGMKMWRRAVAVTDWLFVVLLGGTALYEIWAHPLFDDGIPGSRPVNTALFLVIGLAFAWRRRAPTMVLFVVVAAVLAQMLFVDPSPQAPLQSFLAILLAFYSVAAHADERRAVLGGAIAAASIVVVDLVKLFAGENPGDVIPSWIFVGAVWAMGWTLHRRRLQSMWLESRAAALEREREEQARAAVAEERARISRELHDVVAHGVSVTVVQAQAAQRLLEGEHPETRKALGSIETTGRQVLVELRRMLGVLRQGDEQLTLAPQPGLGSLEDLAQQFRASGLPVELRVEGEASPLPPGVDLSAYRIVQEALTNTLKHAGPARAVVTVRYRNDEVELEVADDGPGTGEGGGSGHGLIGMRERAALYGGAFESGERAGGGHLVRARLSLGSPAGDPSAEPGA
jgi:signal transduction histidine kinase